MNGICFYFKSLILNIIHEFRFDRLKIVNFSFGMRQLQYQKLLSKTQILIGIILSIGVFVLMSIILKPFTFSPDPTIAQIQACFAAVPIATTFWFACNMFMLVLSDQMKRKKEKAE